MVDSDRIKLSHQSSYSGKGGFYGVEGWTVRNRFQVKRFLNDGFKSDPDYYPEFQNPEEVREFIFGEGQYENKNSFFYTVEDFKEQLEEGFMQNPYCHKCVEEATSSPIEEEIDPEIEPQHIEYTSESYRPGFEKKVIETWYQCGDHPEVHINQKDSTWQEK